jgi:hypothetical protein
MLSLRHIALSCAVSSLALLSACESGAVKETLGLSRNAPDEFRVLPRPALSVPPQFGLRPPALPGEENAVGEISPSKQAEALVLGPDKNAKGDTFKLKPGSTETAVQPVTVSSDTKRKGQTGAEAQFLENAGAAKADPSVRTSLIQEKIAVEEPEEEKSWWNIMPSSSDKKEPIVQPGKEAERIQQNKAENKPITEGETPASKPKDRGVLGSILGD